MPNHRGADFWCFVVHLTPYMFGQHVSQFPVDKSETAIWSKGEEASESALTHDLTLHQPISAGKQTID